MVHLGGVPVGYCCFTSFWPLVVARVCSAVEWVARVTGPRGLCDGHGNLRGGDVDTYSAGRSDGYLYVWHRTAQQQHIWLVGRGGGHVDTAHDAAPLSARDTCTLGVHFKGGPRGMMDRRTMLRRLGGTLYCNRPTDGIRIRSMLVGRFGYGAAPPALRRNGHETRAGYNRHGGGWDFRGFPLMVLRSPLLGGFGVGCPGLRQQPG